MMISDRINQTNARINKIMSKVLIFLIILVPGFYACFSFLHGQEPDAMASGELIVRGVELKINPAQQSVPINTETVVNTVFSLDNPELVEGMIVKGTLRGPGIKDPITLTTLPNHPFAIPGFTTKGTYLLENIQLEKDGKKLVTAEPEQAVIEAMDIIVTKVESRPLSLEEIREKGIVISEENFQVYNFSVGFVVNSQEVKYDFPIVYSGNNEVYIPSSYSGSGMGLPGGPRVREPVPIKFDLPDIELPGGDVGKQETSRPVSGVVIFNNDIAFLNQFFSVMFIVSNQAPEESLLTLKEVSAKITFPDGLREAETNPPHLMGVPVPVRCPGPDGKIGTADDLDIILATFSGMAEFLAEGLEEGTHIVDIDFEGTLSGLPSGDTPFSGTASGAVIVRNPEFGITFAHPSVIRKGEEYDIYVTMTNTSPVTANLVSLTMPATRLVGTILLSDETVSWESIEPGESVTAQFHMQANETGKIRASAFEAEGSVIGRFVLTAGVGEKGIPLSPDTLVLPEWAYSLPNELINASLMLLGEAYSIATTPPGGLPAGLPYISSDSVKQRAVEFANAGQRYSYGDSLINTVEILTLDWLGSRFQDINFDILRRLTSKGLKFAQQQAIIFNAALTSQSGQEFQRSFAQTCSYKPAFISALLSFGGGSRSAAIRITDFYQNRLSDEQGDLELIRNIPYGELYLMEDPGQNPVDFALIGEPDENGYTMEIIGEGEGSFDFSLIVPDSSGGFRQVVFSGVSSQPGSMASITITNAASGFTLSIDNNGDGEEDSRVSGNVTAVQAPPLQLLGAVQECSADAAGHATALFFNRPLDPESAKDKANYYVSDKSIYASFLQPSGRVVLIGTNNPISPFVESRIRVENLKDTSGGLITPSPTEMAIISTIKTPGGIIFGKVLSALGEPISNAKIQLEERNGSKRTLSFDRSDSSGSYQFDFVRILPDPFTIKVQEVSTGKIETVSSRLMSNGQRLQMDIIMRGRGSVQGRVLDSNGIALANAVVSARAEGTGIWESFATSTDENGAYMINDIPIGNVNLSAGKSGQYGSASTAITAPEQIQTVDITVVAAKTARVSGRVFYNDGVTPGAEAYVNFYGEHQYASGTQTDEQGYFQFPTVPVGTFSIKAYNPLTGKQGGYVSGELVENQDFNATIIFRGTGRIHGKVVSYDGVPQSGVFVYLSNTSFYMDTDSDGKFDFQEVPVGDYYVIAVHRTVNLKTSSRVELITEGQEAYVSLVFANTTTGSITGKVYDVDGSTILPDTDVYIIDGNHIARGLATSNQSGVFSVGNLPTGTYIVFIAKPGSAGIARTTIQFPGHQAECDVQYLGKGKVNVNVFASDGQTRVITDVTFRRIIFEMEEGSYIGFRTIEEKYTSGESGALEIDNVYMGNFSVKAENEFYPRGDSYYGSIDTPGQEVNVDLVMKPSGKVNVTVVNWDGQSPVSGAALEFKASSLPLIKDKFTEEDGTFEFTLVPPGNFYVTAKDTVSGLRGICYGTMGTDGSTVNVTVRLLGKGQVKGVVKNQSGDLIPNARVTLKNKGFPNEIYETTSGAQGDFLGQFSIGGVWQGEFTVSAFFSELQIGGRSQGEITGHNAQANVEVVLDAIGTVKGRVMSPDGVSEMTDTQVVLYHSRFDYNAVGYYYVSEEGGYTFENIPKGQFYLEAIHPASGRKGKRSGSVTTEGQIVEVDVYLESRGTVTGTFYDGSGVNPVPHAGIKIKSQGTYPFTLESTTDGEGNFTFGQVARGEFNLDATDPANGLKGSASGQVEYEGETVYIDVIAQGWGSVTGKVYKADGTLDNMGARVALKQRSKTYEAYADKSSGEYYIQFVPTGSFTVYAYEYPGERDYGTASGKIEFHGQVATVDITFKGLGSVTGHVVDGSGNHMPGISVTLTSGYEKFTTVSNSDGIYSFDDIRMGPFSLEAKQGGTNLSASGSGELTQDGQSVSLDLVLESAGSVKGRILNPDGTTPAENAYVKLKGSNFSKYYSTGPGGEFEFNAVRLGGFTLEVQGYNQEGKARVCGQVDHDGEIVDVGDLVLDNELPRVTEINFSNGSSVNGSSGVPLSTALTIKFSEALAASTITGSTIYLNCNQGKVGGELALQPDGKSVVFTPNLLGSFILYTLNVTTSVEDVAGNRLETAASASFTTSDIQPPVVVAVNPANNARGVPIDAVIIVTFNEPVDDSKFNNQNFIVKKGDLTNGEPVNPQSLVFDESKTSVTFVPDSPLLANASYTVWLSNFYDFSNNLQTAEFTSHFNAIDTLPPTFKSISPPDGTTVTEGAPLTVTVTFNENDIAVVHFSVNGQTKYSDTSSPYKYQFTTPLISEVGNSILVEVLAVDNAGNQSSKANLTINLRQDTPPQITLTGPAAPTVLPGGTIDCSVTASDDLGLSRVIVTAVGGTLNYSNTQNISNSSTSFTKNYTIAVPGDILPNTDIILHAHAVDIRGNVSNATDIPIKVPQDEQDPLVTILSPDPGASFQYGQSITIQAQASDDVGLKEVRIYFNDQLVETFTQQPYETVYGPLSKDIDGEVGIRTIKAEAEDLLGNTAAATVDINLKETEDPDAPEVKILSPSQGSLVFANENLKIKVDAVDYINDQQTDVQQVEVYVDDQLYQTLTESPYEADYTVPADAAPGSSIGFKAVALAYDGKTGSDQVSVEVTTGTFLPDGTMIEADNTDYENQSIIINEGTVTINGAHTFSNVLVKENGVLTHSGCTTSAVYKMQLNITGKLVIGEAARVNVNARGYLGGYRGGNPSNYGYTLGNSSDGGSYRYSGASYGGHGGKYNEDAMNKIYGSIDNPSDPGSGGGGSSSNNPGGSGGGVIIISTSEIVNDGHITTNGYDANLAGAGSGGTININTAILTGSGRITANGGDSSTYAAGGGGRIAVCYENASGFNLENITAYGGRYTNGNSWSRDGSAGTVYLKQLNREPQLIIDNNSLHNKYRQIFPDIGPGEITVLSANVLTDTNASYMPGSLIGMELIPDINHREQTFTIIANDKTSITVDSADGDLTQAAGVGDSYAGMAVFNGDLILRHGTISEIKGDTRLGNLSVVQESTLAQSATTIDNVYSLSLKVSGKVFVDDTSKINANGSGYLGGMRGGNATHYGYTLGNSSDGGSYYYSGASYGGMGGQYSTHAVNGVYGSLYEPGDPGSGGGGYSTNNPGGSGGGVIIIAAQELQIEGTICCNGYDANLAGGGSGGSIKINTTLLRGIGTITANGGNSTSYAAGGGGRIAVYYEEASAFDLTRITAYGGIYTSGTSTSLNAGAGTIYLEKKGQMGEIIINNRASASRNGTPLVEAAPGTITSLEAHKLVDENANFIPGSLVGMKVIPNTNKQDSFTITANTPTEIFTSPSGGDMTLVASVGDRYGFKYSSNVVLDRSQASLNGSFTFSDVTLMNATLTIDGTLEAGTLTLQNGSILTHSPASTAATSSMNLQVNDLVIDESSAVQANGRGYLGGYCGDNDSQFGRTLGNVPGSELYSGGSYGGYGGMYGTNAINDIYGSIYRPEQPGSGGGGYGANDAGGSGGGVIRISADEIVNNGVISANGGDANSPGAGSGGSVWIDTVTLSGSGIISDNGGVSTKRRSGGGGRIAVYYNDASGFDLSAITAYGGTNSSEPGSSWSIGSAGSVYLKKNGEEDQLIINNRDNGSQNPRIMPDIRPAAITGLTQDTLTDTNASFMPGSLVDMKLIPNIENPDQTFTIIDNDKTTIIVDSAAGDLTTAAVVGDTYRGKFVFPGHLRINQCYRADINGEVEVGNASITGNSILSHTYCSITSEYYLALKVTGKIFIESGSMLTATGRGYAGGYNSDNPDRYGRTLGNVQGSDRYSGGSYGGYGGIYSTYAVNEPYGSLYRPSHPGSGGGGVGSNSRGGMGGGVLHINANEIENNGEISANGQNVDYAAGAGSGGSIWLEVDTLSGSGIISANGGTSLKSGGGGGRIAVYYEDASAFDLTKITAYGGFYTGGASTSLNGGAGTVFLKQSTANLGDLIVNNNSISSRQDSTPLPAVGQGFNTLLEANRMVNSAASFTPASLIGIKLNPQPTGDTVFTIVNNNGTEIFTDPADGDMTQTAGTGGAYIGEHLLFNLTVKGNGRLFTLDRIKVSGTLTVEPGSTLIAENHQ